MPEHTRQWYPTNQRIVVLTFEDAEAAADWDSAGQPLTIAWPVEVSVGEPE
jgi:hypothetical protein